MDDPTLEELESVWPAGEGQEWEEGKFKKRGSTRDHPYWFIGDLIQLQKVIRPSQRGEVNIHWTVFFRPDPDGPGFRVHGPNWLQPLYNLATTQANFHQGELGYFDTRIELIEEFDGPDRPYTEEEFDEFLQRIVDAT